MIGQALLKLSERHAFDAVVPVRSLKLTEGGRRPVSDARAHVAKVKTLSPAWHIEPWEHSKCLKLVGSA